jgi:hypothetical protein
VWNFIGAALGSGRLHTYLIVLIIFNLGLFFKDKSSRRVVEEVFFNESQTILELDQIESLFVPPTKPYPFIACNDTEHPFIFAALTKYDFNKNSWVSHGWLPLSKGCSIINEKMRGPVYGYVITKDRSVVWSGGDGVSGAPFCLNTSDTFKVSLNDCEEMQKNNMAVNINFYEQIYAPKTDTNLTRPVFWRIKSANSIYSH